MDKILITGATGGMGSVVIETLLRHMPAQRIAALTRTAEKQTELQSKGLHASIGNYNDTDSLERAMTGIDTVLLISSNDRNGRMQQHRNVIDAAKKTGVKTIAYTGRSLRDRDTLANTLMLEHFETEDYIRASGLQHIIFQNALYMESIMGYTGEHVFDQGRFSTSAGAGRVSYPLRRELAEAMGNVLARAHTGSQVYKLTADQTYSFYDVADVLTDLCGRQVRYEPVEEPALIAMLLERGMPEAVARMLAAFNTDIRNGQEDIVTGDLEEQLGRRPATLHDGLKELFGF